MSQLKEVWQLLQRQYDDQLYPYPMNELIYQINGLIKECDQKLDGGYFAPDYVAEKLNAIKGYAQEIIMEAAT